MNRFKEGALVGDLDQVQPEKVIWLNGIDFLHIYRASDLLTHVNQPTLTGVR